MDIFELASVINGEVIFLKEKYLIGKFIIDSRKIEKDDIFITLAGNKLDGFSYLDDAVERGCSCVITDRDCVREDISIIKVSDTYASLIEIGNMIRKKHLDIPLIALTGSVGKTTTKELISYILESKYKVLKSHGNMNNHIGVPLTLFQLNNSYDLCVLELGMNHLGEIDKLSKCCLPSDAVITNVGSSHIGYLKSKKNIFKAKKEIVNGMSNGTLFINGDDKYLRKIKYNKTIKVGLEKKNDIRAYNIISTKNRLYFNINVNNRRYNIAFSIPNEVLVYNILLAIAVCLKYNVDMNTIVERINNYRSIDGRNMVIKTNDCIVIDDCYNSSYESLKWSLSILNKYDEEKIIVIGDILELGKHSKKIHKRIGKLLKNYDGLIIFVGREVKWSSKYVDSLVVENQNEACELLAKLNLKNKVIFLKGSRKIELDKVKDYIIKTY